jgi:hypothetical protein
MRTGMTSPSATQKRPLVRSGSASELVARHAPWARQIIRNYPSSRGLSGDLV